MLSAHPPPEKVVVGETLPVPRDLNGTTEREGVKVGEDLERDLAREERERVEADEVMDLSGEERELWE